MSVIQMSCQLSVFLFNDTATPAIYTLSLHDALPIFATSVGKVVSSASGRRVKIDFRLRKADDLSVAIRSEEHTSELQSHSDLVCRLLLEKKKDTNTRLSSRKQSALCILPMS